MPRDPGRLAVDLVADVPEADLLVLPFSGEALPDAWRERLGAAAAPAVADAVRTKGAAVVYGETGRVALVPVAGETDEDRRVAAAQGAAEAVRLRAEAVALVAPDGAAYVEGFLLGAYRFTRYRTEAEAAWAGPSRLRVVAPEAEREAVDRARILAEATNLARDLVNRSPHETTALHLGALAREAAEPHGVRVAVRDKAWIEEEGMGGLLAVNRGSFAPPAFIELEWAPEGTAEPAGQAPVVLVGKAVTFDTGGLSLKPTKGSMDRMKADMAGGAAVIGALVAAARLNLPLRVIGLVPSTDNRPGEDAFVPGDVVRMHGGATVEVLNTDAEGRMLLADALSYARRFEPALVVDLATLTGAAVVALGDRVAAVVTRDDEDAEARLAPFRRAGEATGDLVWPLPLFAFYEEQLKSDVADLKNVGGREAGAITAAAFLEHFTRADGEPAYPWVHVDLAGPAFLDKGYGYRPAGGTGFGVRLLAAVLEERARA